MIPAHSQVVQQLRLKTELDHLIEPDLVRLMMLFVYVVGVIQQRLQLGHHHEMAGAGRVH